MQKAADINVVIGQRVRLLRKASGVTQQELADRCGMFRTYISRIENGTANPSLQVLANLAELFGISISHLIRETQSDLDLQAVPLADRRALLGFSLNGLQSMAQEEGQDVADLSRYHAQLCSVCRRSKL
jgi:DNA-binding XRE family transcriptional regulator